MQNMREQNPKVAEIPFNSTNKYQVPGLGNERQGGCGQVGLMAGLQAGLRGLLAPASTQS